MRHVRSYYKPEEDVITCSITDPALLEEEAQ